MSPTPGAVPGNPSGSPISRVLIISPTAGWGGAELYLTAVLTALRDAGASVDLAVTHVQETEALYELATALGQRTWNIGLYQPGGSAQESLRRITAAFRAAVGVMRHARPDRVLLSLPSPGRAAPALLAAATLGIPVVAVFQYVETGFALGALDRVAHRLAMREDTIWIAVSAANAAALTRAFPPAASHIRIVHNGVELPPHDSDGIARSEARAAVCASLELDADAQLVISVGRLTAQKGYRYLIPAIDLVRQRLPDARFVWVGSGPDETSLREAVADHGLQGIVRFAGFRSDVDVFLRAADVFLMPSLNEGTPFALLEAMSLEAAVAVADTPALTEVIAHDQLGWVFDVEDPAAIERAVSEVLGDPDRAQRVGVAGRQRVESQYSRAYMLRAVVDCVLGRDTPHGAHEEVDKAR